MKCHCPVNRCQKGLIRLQGLFASTDQLLGVKSAAAEQQYLPEMSPHEADDSAVDPVKPMRFAMSMICMLHSHIVEWFLHAKDFFYRYTVGMLDAHEPTI